VLVSITTVEIQMVIRQFGAQLWVMKARHGVTVSLMLPMSVMLTTTGQSTPGILCMLEGHTVRMKE
jgi:hypothetical protein